MSTSAGKFEEADRNKQSILIIDNDQVDRQVLAEFLPDSGYEVLEADDGEVGFQTAQRTQPDLILLDALLTGLDGFEACLQLKADAQTQDIPVIFVSTKADIDSKLKAFEVGGVDFISKPFHRDEVLARIVPHLNIRRLTREFQLARVTLEAEVEARTHALQLSEERYRALYRDNPSMFFTLDSEGMIVSVNKFGAMQLGYTVEELEGQSVLKVFHENDHTAVSTQLNQCLQNPWQAMHWQFRKIHKDGRTLWVEEFARAVERPDGGIQVLVVCQDITERKQAEEALHNAHQHLENIIEFLPDATFVIDHKGKVIAWNRAIEVMTEMNKAEIIGKGNYAYAVPFYGGPRPMLIDLVKEEHPDIAETYDYLEKQGSILYAETFIPFLNEGVGTCLWSSASPLLDEAGNHYGAIQTIRNVTERVRSEEELRKHRDHLEEVVKIRTAELAVAKEKAEVANQAKSIFLSNMSHELRTPLNAILGYAQILTEEPFDAKIQTELNIIKESGEHLLMLIDDILDISKIEAGKMELFPVPIHLPAFFRSITNVIQSRAAQKNIVFEMADPQSLLPEVLVDETRLRQILLNLLGNAIKFTDSGKVSLRVKLLNDVTTAVSQAHLHFAVEDTGIGISSEESERLFQPFEQVGDMGRRIGGTGLGLSISRQLVRLMGGDLQMESTLGQGTTFWFDIYLPITTRYASTAAGQSIIGYKGEQKTILVVDDSFRNRAMIIDLLQPLGFKIIEAKNGQQAIELAQKAAPDLILMDQIMPEMDGKTAVQQLRQIPQGQQLPIIAISGSALPENRVQSQTIGFNDSLPKPINISGLVTLLEEHLKLEWHFKEVESPLVSNQSTEELKPPPQHELATLYDLAMRGNIRLIREHASHIAALNEELEPFANKLHQFAIVFDSNAILELINQYWEGTP